MANSTFHLGLIASSQGFIVGPAAHRDLWEDTFLGACVKDRVS